jgi:hypothetical protein
MSTEDDDDDGDVSGYYTDMGDGRTVMVGEISDALFKSETARSGRIGAGGSWISTVRVGRGWSPSASVSGMRGS